MPVCACLKEHMRIDCVLRSINRLPGQRC